MEIIDLHSEQRKRPGFTAFKCFEHVGQAKIFGKTDCSSCVCFLKFEIACSKEFSMKKNWAKPKS